MTNGTASHLASVRPDRDGGLRAICASERGRIVPYLDDFRVLADEERCARCVEIVNAGRSLS